MFKAVKRSTVKVFTGSLPPDVCGVGDYTANLLKALSKTDTFVVEALYRPTWNFSLLCQDLLMSYFSRCIFHLQYPTEGFGYRLTPLVFWLFCNGPRVLTLHEFQCKALSGKLYCYILFRFSSVVILSSELELLNLSKFFPFFKKLLDFVRPWPHLHILPIPSNILVDEFDYNEFVKDGPDLVYFGQIRPQKGIEDFISLCELIRFSGLRSSICFVAAIPSNHVDYASEVIASLSAHNVTLLLDRSADEVFRILSSAKVAFLPFPDGPSLKRGSLMAICACKCQVITNFPSDDSNFGLFDRSLFLVSSIEQAFAVFSGLIDCNIQLRPSHLISDGNTFFDLASRHVLIYETMT